MASINTSSFDLRALIESKTAGKISLRKVWVPKYCLVCVDRLKKEWSTNSLENEFVPPREKVIKRSTHPRGRFTAPRENDAGMFRKCSSRNKAIP